MRTSGQQLRSRAATAGLMLLGVAAFLVVAFALESAIGVPFDTSYRVGCAALSLFFILKLWSDYPRERWPRIGFWAALLVNTALFFTPLLSHPASRGEIMVFAVPDATILLVARIATYRVVDLHQRAMRQQMILGLVVAVVCCAILLGMLLKESQPVRPGAGPVPSMLESGRSR